MPLDPNKQLTTLTGARQTMMSWSKIIESREAVPEIYKTFFNAAPGETQEFPYTVLAPALDGFPRRTSEKLICYRDQTLYILERHSNRFSTLGYPVKTIQTVETGNVLLRSWVTISGVTIEGIAASTKVEFNAAVGERYFAPFLSKIRPAAIELDETSHGVEQAKFDALAAANFKLMNMGRASLIRGEKIIQLVFQPEIRKRAGAFFGWVFYKTITPAYLTILTDKEIVLVQEPERGIGGSAARYGCIQRYISLSNIRKITVNEQENNLLNLSIHLSQDKRVEKFFDLSTKQEMEQLWGEIEKLI